MVHEPAYQGGRHLLVIEHVDPPGKLQVSVQYDGFLLMDIAEIVKEQLGAGTVVGDVPPLVEDNDRCPIQFFKDCP